MHQSDDHFSAKRGVPANRTEERSAPRACRHAEVLSALAALGTSPIDFSAAARCESRDSSGSDVQSILESAAMMLLSSLGARRRRRLRANATRSQKSEHVTRCAMSRATRPSRGVWDESEVREQEVVRRKVGHTTRLGPVFTSAIR